MIDQTRLPMEEIYVECHDYKSVSKAIRNMLIRGAPAIGVAAAMGVSLGANKIKADSNESFLLEFQQICDELTGNLERPPTEEEIAEHLSLKLNEYRELLDQVQKRVYISFNDQWARIESDEAIEEKLDEKQLDPSAEASNRDLQELVRRRLTEMNPKQQKVIAFYYYEGLRLRDIAEIMNITESRVCQIHTEAVITLRSFIKRIETTGTKECFRR